MPSLQTLQKVGKNGSSVRWIGKYTVCCLCETYIVRIHSHLDTEAEQPC